MNNNIGQPPPHGDGHAHLIPDSPNIDEGVAEHDDDEEVPEHEDDDNVNFVYSRICQATKLAYILCKQRHHDKPELWRDPGKLALYHPWYTRPLIKKIPMETWTYLDFDWTIFDRIQLTSTITGLRLFV